MLLAELKPSKHAVDFLHPRRRAAPPNPRKKWIIAGAVAGSLLAVWLIYSRIEHFLLVDAVTTLEREKADLDKEIEHANKAIANTGDIAKWATEDVIWLDRIYELEQGFPPPEEAVLNQLTAITGKGKDNTGKNGEQITLKGRARGLDGIVHMGKGISDHGGKMSIRNTSDDSAVPPYSVSFEVWVLPEKGEKP